MNKKILYLFDQTDWKSRMPVAEAAKAAGYDVTIALIGAPIGGDKETRDHPGFKMRLIRTTGARMTIFAFLDAIRNIYEVLKLAQPDLVHAITLKYAFMTGLAALSVPQPRRIYTIAGLGYLFRSGSIKAACLRALLLPLLKMTLNNPRTTLIVQNPDDRDVLFDYRLAVPERTVLVRGSGVDLARFAPLPNPQGETPLVLMPTRLVREKGIEIFVQTARILKARGINARFQIAGGIAKHNPTALTTTEMERLTHDGATEWLGHVADMPTLLAHAALVVYPSWYGEGIPRVLLEALAAGKPIITTDHPGCREAARHGENGLLVPIKNAEATAEAIEHLLHNPALRAQMGMRSRVIAETEFSLAQTVRGTLAAYGGAHP